jgi:hypothetical protein
MKGLVYQADEFVMKREIIRASVQSGYAFRELMA